MFLSLSFPERGLPAYFKSWYLRERLLIEKASREWKWSSPETGDTDRHLLHLLPPAWSNKTSVSLWKQQMPRALYFETVDWGMEPRILFIMTANRICIHKSHGTETNEEAALSGYRRIPYTLLQHAHTIAIHSGLAQREQEKIAHL